MTDKERFEAAVAEEPLDFVRRLVFADFLEEQGEIEEAERQRKFEASYLWLQEFIAEIDDDCCTWDEEYENKTRTSSPGYERVLDAAKYWVESVNGPRRTYDGGGHITFGHDDGPVNARKAGDEFWDALEIVTGIRVTQKKRKSATFSCAC